MERKETKRGVCKEAGSEAAVHDWSEVAVHDSGRGDLTMPDLDVRIGPVASIHGIVVTHFLERVSPRVINVFLSTLLWLVLIVPS